MDETREIDIDLRKIFYMLRTKLIFIVLITVVFGLSSAIYTHFFIDPTYSTKVSLCVSANPDRVSTDRVISPTEITAAHDLVRTYMFALTSDRVLDQVAEELNLGSGSSIKGSIITEAVEDTFVFTVTVSSKDPQRCVDIANAIAKIAPDETVKVVKAGAISVIDTAKLPRTPTSPNAKKNILIGLAIGFVISFASFFIYEMFDTTITNAKDLERDFELPVLGTVPMLDTVEKSDSENDNGEEGNGTEEDLDLPIPKPSSALLEKLQSMKGEADND